MQWLLYTNELRHDVYLIFLESIPWEFWLLHTPLIQYYHQSCNYAAPKIHFKKNRRKVQILTMMSLRESTFCYVWESITTWKIIFLKIRNTIIMKFTYLNFEFFRLNDRSLQGLSPVENEKSCLINYWNFTENHRVP